MALREHLVELRNRLLKASVALLLGALLGWFLYLPVLDALAEPVARVARESGRTASLNFSNVIGALDLRIKVSIFIGVIVSSPVWIFQLWAFVTPGLTRKERRYALGFMFSAVPLFLAGAYLAFRSVPTFVLFLLEFTPEDGSNVIDATLYLSFVMRVILGFGVSFLVPVVLVALNFVGLISGRSMVKAWRWVVVAAFTFAAIATPTPDILSMFLLALPLLFLFCVAIGIALLNDRRRRRASGEPDLSDLADDEASAL